MLAVLHPWKSEHLSRVPTPHEDISLTLGQCPGATDGPGALGHGDVYRAARARGRHRRLGERQRQRRTERDGSCDQLRLGLPQRNQRDANRRAIPGIIVLGLERIWGHRWDHVFYPIWWDPKHEVCPSTKKHT